MNRQAVIERVTRNYMLGPLADLQSGKITQADFDAVLQQRAPQIRAEVKRTLNEQLARCACGAPAVKTVAGRPLCATHGATAPRQPLPAKVAAAAAALQAQEQAA